jgi:hypothetical protein
MKEIKTMFRKLDIFPPSDDREGKAPIAKKRILPVPRPIPQNFPKFDMDDGEVTVR